MGLCCVLLILLTSVGVWRGTLANSPESFSWEPPALIDKEVQMAKEGRCGFFAPLLPFSVDVVSWQEWSSSNSCRFPCCWLWQRDLGARSMCWNPTLIGIAEVQAPVLGQGSLSEPPSCSRWCLLLLHRTAVRAERCHIAVIAHDWHLWGRHCQPSSLMTHCRGVGAISSFLQYSTYCRHPWQPWKHASWVNNIGKEPCCFLYPILGLAVMGHSVFNLA